ncbi:MAG: glycoside hydrolase family 172 protein, partial [bacterium]
ADAMCLETSLRAMVIRMSFDGEETVWCPVSDFFGSGYGLNELRNWYRTVDKDGVMSCRWVMPYRKAARLTLNNHGKVPVNVGMDVRTKDWAWDEQTMHFHANWHCQFDMKTPPYTDWNYIGIKGRGVYVGDTLALFNPVPTWYGEGNEKIWVDGESFPSHLGTGTEDYYNFSWAPKPVFQTPFASEVRIDEAMTQGHNVLTRTRNLDGIPFEQSLKFDMELIPWQETHVTYAATTYWYAMPGAVSNIEPMPEAAARTFRHISPLIVNMMVSKLMPSAGKLGGLKYPTSLEGMDFKPRTFYQFCDLHPELSAREPEDLLVYYSCRFECARSMKIVALLGYDGPVKMWIDGKECFHDPDGVNPALIDRGRAVVDVTSGVHELLVGLGSNFGKAWGIYLRIESLTLEATEGLRMLNCQEK